MTKVFIAVYDADNGAYGESKAFFDKVKAQKWLDDAINDDKQSRLNDDELSNNVDYSAYICEYEVE